MVTELQILANRRNAQKSPGPRTLSISLGLPPAKTFAKTSAPAELIMQNKPNFLIAKMNASFVPTNGYENENAFRLRKYKPSQSQFQTPQHSRLGGNGPFTLEGNFCRGCRHSQSENKAGTRIYRLVTNGTGCAAVTWCRRRPNLAIFTSAAITKTKPDIDWR